MTFVAPAMMKTNLFSRMLASLLLLGLAAAPALSADSVATAFVERTEPVVVTTHQALPALRNLKNLTTNEREAIAQDLSRFTGMPLDKIDRKVLAFLQPDYRRNFFGNGRVLDIMDLRRTSSTLDPPGTRALAGRYVRETLSYRSELAYAGEEEGYAAQTGPAYQGPGTRRTVRLHEHVRRQ